MWLDPYVKPLNTYLMLHNNVIPIHTCPLIPGPSGEGILRCPALLFASHRDSTHHLLAGAGGLQDPAPLLLEHGDQRHLLDPP